MIKRYFKDIIGLFLVTLMSLTAHAQPTPPSNPLRIGNTVVGGTAQSVLFVDSSGKLAQDNPYLIYDPVQNWLTISGNSAYEGLISVGKILTRSPDGTTSPIYMLTRDDPYSGDATYGGIFGVYDEATTLIAGISDSGGFKFGPNYTSTSSANTFEQSTVFNESGAGGTADFRIETDALANAFFVDASANFIGFGTNSPAYGVEFVVAQGGAPYYANVGFRPTGSNQDMALEIESTRNGTTQRWFFGTGSGGAPNTNNFRIYDLNNSTEAINIIPGTSPTLLLKGDQTTNARIILGTSASTPTVFNEQGDAQDFRVEGDTKTHLLYIGGSAGDIVGINANSTEISAGGGSVLTAKSDANGGFTNVFGALAPSTTAGNRACFNVGVTNSSNDLNSFCFKYVGAGNTTNAFETFFSFASTPAMRVLANNKGGIGIGSSDPSAVWHVIGTAEQERLGYDGSNYLSTTVSSAGAVTWDAVGASAGFTFSDSVTMADTKNIILNTSTGTKIGTGTTQKLGFWNATPVAQQSGTGETVGFTAGAGTNVTDQSTFTGNVGSTAYRISDIVKALKNIGALAQ